MKLKNDYDLVRVAVIFNIAESIFEKGEDEGDAQLESQESRWAHGRSVARRMASNGTAG